jgi:OOP family OmpA-OmpF porin
MRLKAGWRWILLLPVVVGCVLIGDVPSGVAQEETSGQLSKAEMLRILSQEPTNPLLGEGVSTKGTNEGISKGIENVEYDRLIQNPHVSVPIQFDSGADTIKSSSYRILRELGEVLRQELPDITICIAGHTDNVGSDLYNLELSKRRAQEVQKFLMELFDIDPNRLILQGFGEREPFTSNKTAAGRAQNRRVEFVRIQ